MTDADPHDICGSTGTDSGDPCQRPAGWGRESDRGHCVDHKGRGRDPKLTKERQEAIATMIEQGHSITAAARSNGIHKETFLNWMQRGEQEAETIYAEFFDRLTRARGEGEATYQKALMRIALENDDPATLMSMLKQRYPGSWGDVDRGEQTGGVVVDLGEAEEYEIDPETLEIVE